MFRSTLVTYPLLCGLKTQDQSSDGHPPIHRDPFSEREPSETEGWGWYGPLWYLRGQDGLPDCFYERENPVDPTVHPLSLQWKDLEVDNNV